MIFVQFGEMALEGEEGACVCCKPQPQPVLCCAGRAMLRFPCCCWIAALLLDVLLFEIPISLPEEDKLDTASWEARENVQS